MQTKNEVKSKNNIFLSEFKSILISFIVNSTMKFRLYFTDNCPIFMNEFYEINK